MAIPKMVQRKKKKKKKSNWHFGNVNKENFLLICSLIYIVIYNEKRSSNVKK